MTSVISPRSTDEIPRGRPRSQQTHAAILEAARELLRQEGEARFSFERVASLAGVSKASIYRRWPCKGALLMELYMEGFSEKVRTDAESFHEEIKRYLLATVERLKNPLWRSILCSLMVEGQHDAFTANLLRQKVVEPRRAEGLALLEHAVRKKHIPPGLNHDLILDILFGPLWYRVFFGHAPISSDFVENLLTQIEPILFAEQNMASQKEE